MDYCKYIWLYRSFYMFHNYSVLSLKCILFMKTVGPWPTCDSLLTPKLDNYTEIFKFGKKILSGPPWFLETRSDKYKLIFFSLAKYLVGVRHINDSSPKIYYYSYLKTLNSFIHSVRIFWEPTWCQILYFILGIQTACNPIQQINLNFD